MTMLPNLRHEKFAQGIAKGHTATDAYIQAGYKARGNSAETNAARLLRNAQVRQRVLELAEELKQAEIADAEEIQRYFTAVMRGVGQDGRPLTFDHVTKDGIIVPIRSMIRDRLRAAELLGKARGIFTFGEVDRDGELQAIADALRNPVPPEDVN